MRVLFTSQLGSGHWRPLAPLAQAAVATGHTVAFATTPYFCARIAEHGFPCFPVGIDDWLQNPQLRPVQPAEPEQAAAVAVNVFVPRAGHNLPELLTLCDQWRPDLIVREQTEYAGCLVAEHLGIPHATVQISAFRRLAANQPLVTPLNRLRASLDLLFDPELAMLYRYLLLLPFPPRYRDPATVLPPTAHFVRHISFDSLHPGDLQTPAWITQLPQRPTVYASLGTAYSDFPEIFAAILDGLRDEPVNLIVTTNNINPASFGPQPPHVHLATYMPQSVIFPCCDLVITHGGSGTVRAAIAHDLPMVVIPIAADQPDNARRCAALGLAQVILPGRRTPEAIRGATRAVLEDRAYRRTAQQLGAEMRALPGPEHVVQLLEQLMHDGCPLLAAR